MAETRQLVNGRVRINLHVYDLKFMLMAIRFLSLGLFLVNQREGRWDLLQSSLFG